MADNRIEIQFGAVLDALKDGLDRAVSTVSQSTDRITASVNQMNRETTEQVQHLSSSVTSSFENIKGSFGSLALKIAAGLGIYKITDEIKDLIKESALLSARVETLDVVMGVVGKNAGYSHDQMKAYADQVKAMGITTRESEQAVVRMAQAQLDLSKANQLARVAQDAAVIGDINSSEALGRLMHGIVTLQPEILRNIGITVNFQAEEKKFADSVGRSTESLTQNEKQQVAFNAVLREGEKIAGTYEAAMGTAGKQLNSMPRYIEEAKLAFGELFKPALTEAVHILTQGLKGLNNVLQSINATLGITKEASQNQLIGEAVERVQNLKKELEYVRKMHMYDKDVVKELDIAERTLANMVEHERQIAAQKLAQVNTQKKINQEQGGTPGGGDDKAAKAAAKAAADIKRLNEQIDDAIAKQTLTQEEQIERQAKAWLKAGADRVKVEEWVSLQLQKIHDKELGQSLQGLKAYQDRVTAALEKNRKEEEEQERQHQETMLKLSEEAIAQKEEEGRGEIDLKRQHIETLEKLEEITEQQKIDGLKRLAEQEYAIEATAILDRMNLYREDEVAYQKYLNDLLKLKQKHELDMQKLTDQSTIAQKKDYDELKNTVRGYVSQVTSSMTSAVKGMLTGTQTLAQGIRGIFDSLLDIVLGVVEKMLTEWIAKNLIMKSVSAATATAEIGNDAVSAAGGAYKAVVGIPVIGPILAPPAAAAAFAAVMAFSSSIASASGGYDIPSGYNPVVQAHAEEMILPKDIAKPLREMVNGGGGGGGTFTFKGIKPDHLYKGRDFLKALKHLERQGHLRTVFER